MELDPLNSAPRRVEAYLDQVLAPLTRSLSAFHQQELRRELRTHLWERVSAYQELGMTEDDAVTEALRQFGGAEDFTRQWRREWTKTTLVSASTLRIWDASKAALRPALAGVAGAFLPFVALEELPCGHYGTLAQLVTTPVGTVLFWGFMGFGFLLLPVLVGAKLGQRLPNAGVGMVAALTAEIAAASLLYAAAQKAALNNLTAESLWSILLALIVVWLPVSSGAAAVSGWWTRRSKTRRLA